VAIGLIGTKTALGIVPIGSGNGLARHLKISLNPTIAFQQMITGSARPMDVGMANGKYFFLASGIGFEGVVSHKFATKGSRGFLQYILSSMQMFGTYKPIRVSGRIDGIPFESTVFTMTFANGSEYGNGAKIAPGASIDDGILQLIKIKPFPFYSGLEIFRKLMMGKLNSSPFFSSDPFHLVELQCDQELQGHLDGEPVLFGRNLKINIVPGALLVQIPGEG
jgi:diacylglycerol kinase family enzyme